MFHGAMPNRTGQYRSMVGMVYSRAFMRPFNERKGLGKGPFMPFAKGTESFFEHPELEAHCVFVDPSLLGPDFMYELACCRPGPCNTDARAKCHLCVCD